MKRLMMTVAAVALAAPAFAQDAATTAPTATDQTAPAQGTMAQDPAAPQATTGAADPLAADGTTAPAGDMATDPAMDGMATGGTATDTPTGMTGTPEAGGTATPGTGGTATTGTGGAAMTGTGTGAADGAAVTTQPMATEGGMGQSVELSAQNPGITASWLMDRAIYTTNQPSTTQWAETTGDTVPGDWNEIANVADLVMTAEGELVGYVADIGGFLGLGAHTVLLSQDMLHVSRFGDDVVLATNYTQEELEALPEFDTNNVMQ